MSQICTAKNFWKAMEFFPVLTETKEGVSQATYAKLFIQSKVRRFWCHRGVYWCGKGRSKTTLRHLDGNWYFCLLKSPNFSKINLRNSDLKLRSFFTLHVPYNRGFLDISRIFSWKPEEQQTKQKKRQIATGRNRIDWDFVVVVNHFDFFVVGASQDFCRLSKRSHISRT